MEGDHLRNTFVVAALSTFLMLAGCSRKEAKVIPPALASAHCDPDGNP